MEDVLYPPDCSAAETLEAMCLAAVEGISRGQLVLTSTNMSS